MECGEDSSASVTQESYGGREEERPYYRIPRVRWDFMCVGTGADVYPVNSRRITRIWRKGGKP